MRHLPGRAAAAVLDAGVAPAPAAGHADMPSAACPGEKWAESAFPLGWQPGDPLDPDGRNLLLQIAVDGMVEELGSLEEGLAAFGFPTLDDMCAAALDPAYDTVDRNDDGVLCVKRHPDTPGTPSDVANAVDNTAHG